MTHKLVTETGRVLYATAEHQVFSTVGWRSVGRLKKGDQIWMQGPLFPIKDCQKKVRIKSISFGGLKHVYDLTVEPDHSYVANGYVVHNSSSNPNMQNIPAKADTYGIRKCFGFRAPKKGTK